MCFIVLKSSTCSWTGRFAMPITSYQRYALKAEITTHLASLRAGDDGYGEYAQAVRDSVSAAGLSLEAVGTSESELALLERFGCKRRVTMYLNRLRSGVHDYEAYAKAIRSSATKIGLSLYAAGTSESELVQLERSCCKAHVIRRLAVLRTGDYLNEYFITEIRDSATAAGLSLEEAGTSEDELKQLQRLAYKSRITWWLKCLRTGDGYSQTDIEDIRRWASDFALTLEELGTTEEELNIFNTDLT
jgi:hypothetical protein